MLKMTIPSSIWGAQHPNAGGNIQHITLNMSSYTHKGLRKIAGLACMTFR